MSENIEAKNVIVGGGVSGLSIAAELDDPDTIIISENVGGLVRTFKEGGFSFDYGGHVYTAKDQRVDELMRECGGTFHEQRKAFYLYEGSIMGENVPFPVQSSGKFKIRRSARDAALVPYLDLETWAREEFGHEFVDAFFSPFNERVWQTPLDQMSCDWIASRVAPASADAKKWGSNSAFWYAPGRKIITALKRRSKAVFIEDQFLDIDYLQHVVVCRNHRVKFHRLFLTVPKPSWAAMLKSAGMLAIGLGLKHELKDLDFHWVYPHVKSPVHRVTLLSRYSPRMAPAGKDSLLFEIPTQSRLNFNLADVQNLIEVAGFGSVLSASDVDVFWQHYEPRSMPVQTRGLRAQVFVRKKRMASHRIHLAGRWGAHGYWNLEDIFKDAHATVCYAQKGVMHDEYFSSAFYYHS